MKNKIKKNTAFVALLSILVMICAVPAMAYDETYLDLRISGTGSDYSYFQNENTDDGDWMIDLDPDYDRPEAVLIAWLKNSEDDNRGYMEVYEGTSNTASSDGTVAGYDYRILGVRENFYDGYITVQGHWYLNY